MKYRKCVTLPTILIFCIPWFLAIPSSASDDDFQPFNYREESGIENRDVAAKFKLLTGSESGGEVLREACSVALVKLSEPRNVAPVFSFNFNRTPVK